MKFDRILLLMDDSPPSLKAVKYGYRLAANLKAKVALLYVIDEALAMGDVDAGIFPEQAMAKLKADADKLLHQTRGHYSKGIETEILTPVGEIKKMVAETAKEWGAKMIVVGTHGRTGIDRLLMGSVAESVLRVSAIPVLLVPMKEK